MLLVYNKLASAEENGVVIHNPLALTPTFLPCRPAYPEAWRQYSTSMSNLSGLTRVWLTRLVSTRLVTDLYSPSGGRGLPRDPLAGL